MLHTFTYLNDLWSWSLTFEAIRLLKCVHDNAFGKIMTHVTKFSTGIYIHVCVYVCVCLYVFLCTHVSFTSNNTNVCVFLCVHTSLVLLQTTPRCVFLCVHMSFTSNNTQVYKKTKAYLCCFAHFGGDG